MANKYKVQIPNEIEEVIIGLGYNPINWLEAQLNALMPSVDKNKAKDLLHGQEAAMAAHHAAVKNQIKVEEA